MFLKLRESKRGRSQLCQSRMQELAASPFQLRVLDVAKALGTSAWLISFCQHIGAVP